MMTHDEKISIRDQSARSTIYKVHMDKIIIFHELLNGVSH